jgi:hypothetical protein
MTTHKATPIKSCAIYKAAELINRSGPYLLAELFAAVDFGPKNTRQRKLDHAFDIGWLCKTAHGAVDVTGKTKQHFAAQAPKQQYIGQITPAAHRPNVFSSSGLSKRHIPNSRGTRQDIPPWSVRAAATFHTKA